MISIIGGVCLLVIGGCIGGIGSALVYRRRERRQAALIEKQQVLAKTKNDLIQLQRERIEESDKYIGELQRQIRQMVGRADYGKTD